MPKTLTPRCHSSEMWQLATRKRQLTACNLQAEHVVAALRPAMARVRAFMISFRFVFELLSYACCTLFHLISIASAQTLARSAKR